MTKNIEDIFPEFLQFKLSCVQDGENTITYTETNETYIPDALKKLMEKGTVI